MEKNPEQREISFEKNEEKLDEEFQMANRMQACCEQVASELVES